MKRRSNIELFGKLTENHITIKGNKLNLRWFDRCILIWSDEDNKKPLPKGILEIVEETLKKENEKQDTEDWENILW
jgi:hypothetical protein